MQAIRRCSALLTNTEASSIPRTGAKPLLVEGNVCAKVHGEKGSKSFSTSDELDFVCESFKEVGTYLDEPLCC